MGVVSRQEGAAQAAQRDQRELNERREISLGFRSRICVHRDLCDFSLCGKWIHRSLAFGCIFALFLRMYQHYCSRRGKQLRNSILGFQEIALLEVSHTGTLKLMVQANFGMGNVRFSMFPPFCWSPSALPLFSSSCLGL